MILKKAKIHVVFIPMKEAFSVSFGEIKGLKSIIIELQDDLGNSGYGESILLPYPMHEFEYFDTGLHTLQAFILPKVSGFECSDDKDILENIEKFSELYSDVIGFNMTKAGLQNAFVDLSLKRNKKSLYEVFETKKKKIEVGVSIGIQKSFHDLQQQVSKYESLGYKKYKFKFSSESYLHDIIKINFNSLDVLKGLDGNGAFNRSNFKKCIDIIDSNEFQMVEQPFSKNNHIDNLFLLDVMETPLCLDESIESIDDIKHYLNSQNKPIVNIKIGRVGGVYEAYKINKYCEEHGIDTWVGGLLETDIGRAFNLAIAGMEHCSYHNDFSAWDEFYMDSIVQNPYTIFEASITLPEIKIGTGYEIDIEKMKRYTLDIYIIDLHA